MFQNHPILFIITLIWKKYVEFFLVFFLYSVLGVIWRHAVKDFRGRLRDSFPEKFTKINLWLTSIYQLVNLILFGVLAVIIIKLYIAN